MEDETRFREEDVSEGFGGVFVFFLVTNMSPKLNVSIPIVRGKIYMPPGKDSRTRQTESLADLFLDEGVFGEVRTKAGGGGRHDCIGGKGRVGGGCGGIRVDGSARGGCRDEATVSVVLVDVRSSAITSRRRSIGVGVNVLSIRARQDLRSDGDGWVLSRGRRRQRRRRREPFSGSSK